MCSKGSQKSKSPLKLAERLRYSNTYVSQSSSQDASSVPRYGNNRAAVLICLFEGENGDVRVILTKRSSTLSSHTGEVALPGGRREKGDKNEAETALREAKEEIGLDPSIVEIVALLEPITATKNIAVYPVIGILWDINAFKPVLNPVEVESMFDVPLEMFLKDENHTLEQHKWMGYNYFFHYFHYEANNTSYVIWALTATVLIEVASIVYQRSPDFENSQPKFWGRSSH